MKRCDLLIVEDDRKIRDLIVESLAPLGLQLLWESDGLSGEARAREYLPSVIVLDLGLPGLSGLRLLERLRPWFKGSVVVVTAWEDEAHKLNAFELGADDYVQKPFSPKELMARVKVALKRTARSTEESSDPIRVGDLVIDVREHRAIGASGQALQLTQTEFRFLALLAEKEGSLIAQRVLLEQVWGPNHAEDTHYLRILVSRLRKKLAESGIKVTISTEPGLGYRMTAE